MVLIQNEQYSREIIHDNDLFVCAIGYEQRSFYLFDQIVSEHPSSNMLVFVFSDFSNYEHARIKVEEINNMNITIIFIAKYQDYSEVQEKIKEFVRQKNTDNDIVIHIDYSSMPRSWYCRLPETLEEVLHENDSAFFWYVEGRYPENYEEYPSAGIDSFSLFSGRPSLRTEKKRVHVIALSYDTVRTQAMITILDPDSFIACNAYDSKNHEIGDNVKQVNKDLLAQSSMVISLKIDDFSFMISKLCEMAYEFQPIGDVIFVPDGPKPLIFAMSLIPGLIKKEGVTCLHISRNLTHFNPINILPKDNVLGFSIKIKSEIKG